MSLTSEFEGFLDQANHSSTIDEIKTAFGRFVSAQGYDNHVLTTIGDCCLESVGWYELPQTYAEAYIGEKWEQIDPILPIARRAHRAFSWDQAIESITLSKRQKNFFQESDRLRVSQGIIIPIHGPNGRCDIISLSSRHRDKTDKTALSTVTLAAFEAWNRSHVISRTPNIIVSRNEVRLTQREIEVLKWVRVHKTNDQIADIMNVSRKTIEFHLKNLFDKLGVPNRYAAVVAALHQGQLKTN
jgi:DNA-binding CsgD family transcriptional regulator